MYINVLLVWLYGRYITKNVFISIKLHACDMNPVQRLRSCTTLVNDMTEDGFTSLPLQILSQCLRPVLREHFVQVVFLQLALVSGAKQRIEPPEEETVRGVGRGEQCIKTSHF